MDLEYANPFAKVVLALEEPLGERFIQVNRSHRSYMGVVYVLILLQREGKSMLGYLLGNRTLDPEYAPFYELVLWQIDGCKYEELVELFLETHDRLMTTRLQERREAVSHGEWLNAENGFPFRLHLLDPLELYEKEEKHLEAYRTKYGKDETFGALPKLHALAFNYKLTPEIELGPIYWPQYFNFYLRLRSILYGNVDAIVAGKPLSVSDEILTPNPLRTTETPLNIPPAFVWENDTPSNASQVELEQSKVGHQSGRKGQRSSRESTGGNSPAPPIWQNLTPSNASQLELEQSKVPIFGPAPVVWKDITRFQTTQSKSGAFDFDSQSGMKGQGLGDSGSMAQNTVNLDYFSFEHLQEVCSPYVFLSCVPLTFSPQDHKSKMPTTTQIFPQGAPSHPPTPSANNTKHLEAGKAVQGSTMDYSLAANMGQQNNAGTWSENPNTRRFATQQSNTAGYNMNQSTHPGDFLFGGFTPLGKTTHHGIPGPAMAGNSSHFGVKYGSNNKGHDSEETPKAIPAVPRGINTSGRSNDQEYGTSVSPTNEAFAAFAASNHGWVDYARSSDPITEDIGFDFEPNSLSKAAQSLPADSLNSSLENRILSTQLGQWAAPNAMAQRMRQGSGYSNQTGNSSGSLVTKDHKFVTRSYAPAVGSHLRHSSQSRPYHIGSDRQFPYQEGPSGPARDLYMSSETQARTKTHREHMPFGDMASATTPSQAGVVRIENVSSGMSSPVPTGARSVSTDASSSTSDTPVLGIEITDEFFNLHN